MHSSLLIGSPGFRVSVPISWHAPIMGRGETPDMRKTYPETYPVLGNGLGFSASCVQFGTTAWLQAEEGIVDMEPVTGMSPE